VIIPLLSTKHSDLLLAGDFNCILNPSDSTGNGSFSRSLEILVRDMELTDAWKKLKSDNGYTHYSPKSASRIDRIYLSRSLSQKFKYRDSRCCMYGPPSRYHPNEDRSTNTHNRQRLLEDEHITPYYRIFRSRAEVLLVKIARTAKNIIPILHSGGADI
jgi:hypothetical protein